MKIVIAVVLVLVLCAVVAAAHKPKTVDEAVEILKTKWLKPKDLDWILRNPEDDVVWTLYRPFGTGVRNEFGLWGDNQALRESCGTQNPEGCSVVIFDRCGNQSEVIHCSRTGKINAKLLSRLGWLRVKDHSMFSHQPGTQLS
jgi:hypothetical protein